MAGEVEFNGGKLIHAKIVDKVNSKIEKGALAAVHAIVLHQTGASTAASSLSSYGQGVRHGQPRPERLAGLTGGRVANPVFTGR